MRGVFGFEENIDFSIYDPDPGVNFELFCLFIVG
jgi:hypothetical protein